MSKFKIGEQVVYKSNVLRIGKVFYNIVPDDKVVVQFDDFPVVVSEDDLERVPEVDNEKLFGYKIEDLIRTINMLKQYSISYYELSTLVSMFTGREISTYINNRYFIQALAERSDKLLTKEGQKFLKKYLKEM